MLLSRMGKQKEIALHQFWLMLEFLDLVNLAGIQFLIGQTSFLILVKCSNSQFQNKIYSDQKNIWGTSEE